jgi:hypothetical protein
MSATDDSNKVKTAGSYRNYIPMTEGATRSGPTATEMEAGGKRLSNLPLEIILSETMVLRGSYICVLILLM